MNIAVLMTCHNRREMTLRCLDTLVVAARAANGCGGTDARANFRVYLVDDGSTDGTGDAVRRWARADDHRDVGVRVIQGNGSLYWAKGMALAWREAMDETRVNGSGCSDRPAFTHVFWLNDDVVLDESALTALLAAYRAHPAAVIVGAMREPVTGKKVYGIANTGLLTGNAVLIPKIVYDRIGPIHGGYQHAWADSDYTLLCRKAHIDLIETGPVGTCAWHEFRPRLDGRGLKWRLKTLFDPKGWCVHDVWLFRRRHFGAIRAWFSAFNFIRHVLTSGWNFWCPLYRIASVMPRAVQRNLWRGLRLIRVDRLLNDEGYYKLQLLGCTGERFLEVAAGGGINSVILWQRLYWNDLIPKLCCDKIEVRRYVTERGLGAMLNDFVSPETGWSSVEEIDFEALPNRFVLKCSQGSGMNIIVHEKSRLDLRRTREQLDTWLRSDFASKCRERQYDWLAPRVFAERLIETETGEAPLDYKFICSDGEVLYGWIDVGRFSDHRRVVFDRQGRVVPGVTIGYAAYVGETPLPGGFRDMVAAAETLSRGIPLVRVDFYDDRGRAVFGEMTFTPDAGCALFRPFTFSQEMARRVRIPDGLK